jgi:hypothetical protein
VSRRTVKIEVIFFHILTMIALTARHTKNLSFKNGIFLIP